MNYEDPLLVTSSKKLCPACNGEKPAIKSCEFCGQSGYLPIDLSGLWDGTAAFLVGGGPSANSMPYHRLRERGVISLGINNVAGHIPCSAWCFSDPQEKFHHGLYMDPSIITFAPIFKLNKQIRKKEGDEFIWQRKKVKHCPNTFGFKRMTQLFPDQFLSTDYAHWGYGGKQDEATRPFKCLCTMLIGLRLLCYLGCKRIYLFGVDFWRGEEQQYSFSQKASLVNGRYRKEEEMLKSIYPVLQEKGISMYNCNPDSKCGIFEHRSFDQAIEDCKNGVPFEPFDLSGWYEKQPKA